MRNKMLWIFFLRFLPHGEFFYLLLSIIFEFEFFTFLSAMGLLEPPENYILKKLCKKVFTSNEPKNYIIFDNNFMYF